MTTTLAATQADGFGYSARTSTTGAVTASARPFLGRRLSWKEFRKLMAEVANDNEPKGEREPA